MTRDDFIRILTPLNPCQEALDWFNASDFDHVRVWANAPRHEWLCWWAEKCRVPSAKMIAAAQAIVALLPASEDHGLPKSPDDPRYHEKMAREYARRVAKEPGCLVHAANCAVVVLGPDAAQKIADAIRSAITVQDLEEGLQWK